MKKLLALVMVMVFAFGMLLSGCGAAPEAPVEAPPAEAAPAAPPAAEAPAEEAPAEEAAPSFDALDPVELKYSSQFAPTHNFSVLDQAMFDEISTQTDGKLTLTPYWNSTLTSATTPYAEVVMGVADIVHAAPGHEADHFVLENAISFFYYGLTEQEALYNSARSSFAAIPEWQAEYEGAIPLVFGTGGNLYVLSTEPIRTLDDMQGKTFRCAVSQAFTLCEKLGASAVRMQLSEMFEALSKGVIDGVILSADSLKGNNLADLVGYATNLHLGGPYVVNKLMNRSTYDGLDPAYQAVLDEAFAQREIAQVESTAQYEEEGLAYGVEMGVELIEFSEEDQAKLFAIYEEMAQEQVALLNEAGYDGDGVYATVRSYVESYVG